jgi:hypothetical protein
MTTEPRRTQIPGSAKIALVKQAVTETGHTH